MSIIWADVVAIAPELSTVAIGGQIAILGIVDRWVDADAWGDRQADGQAYLAAHLATLARRAGAGQLTQEKLGEMSRSYAPPMFLRGSFGTTSYGTWYETMVETLPRAVGIVV